MPDQTIALQLNIDTNAPDAIDQVKQKIDELQQQVDSATKGSQEFANAFANLDNAKTLLDQVSSSTSSLSPQFQKFGDTAAQAFKGIGTAAELAAQNNSDLSKIVENATVAASTAGTQQLANIQKIHTQEIQENESFEKTISDTKTKYQNLDIQNSQKAAAEKKKIIDSEFSTAESGANALMQLADSMVENGKKNTDAQKATALIKIGIDTAKAISSLVAASNENPANAATSGVAGAIQFATGIIEILANISKAKDILAGGSDSGGSSGSSPSLSSASSGINTSAPQLTPQQNTAGTTTIDRTTNGNTSQTGMIKAYVVETDITQAQQRAATLKSQSLH